MEFYFLHNTNIKLVICEEGFGKMKDVGAAHIVTPCDKERGFSPFFLCAPVRTINFFI